MKLKWVLFEDAEVASQFGICQISLGERRRNRQGVLFGVRIAGKGGLDMGTSYETDVVAWASEQARLIRAGRFDLLDREHIAEEIEDVGKNEQRELANRMGCFWHIC